MEYIQHTTGPMGAGCVGGCRISLDLTGIEPVSSDGDPDEVTITSTPPFANGGVHRPKLWHP